MNEITTTAGHAQIMESVLADGDLNKLTTEQRVSYYFQVCESLGLNPYTRPFDYITLNGKKVLYAKRDCADQLRRLRNITLAVTDKRTEDDLYIVTVRATDAHGRSDEDFGAVTISGLKGEPRANAMLKAITKAKRRVTLSICGMGMNDETELESLPGAVIENIELPPAPSDAIPMTKQVPLNRAAAAATPRAPRVTERREVPGDPTELMPLMPPKAKPAASSERTDEQWKVWVDKLRQACAVLYSQEEFKEIGKRPSVGDAIEKGPQWVQRDVDEILADTGRRLAKRASAEPEAHDLPEVEIHGADKLAG